MWHWVKGWVCVGCLCWAGLSSGALAEVLGGGVLGDWVGGGHMVGFWVGLWARAQAGAFGGVLAWFLARALAGVLTDLMER